MLIKVSCILLAAGQSKRMSLGNKLLLKVKNQTILERTVSNITKNKFSEIFIILGHQSNVLKRVIHNFKVKFIINKEFREGIASSISIGVDQLKEDVKGVMICLADMPKISNKVYEKILKVFLESYNIKKPLIIAPKNNATIGNPIIFSNHFFSSLKKLKGDQGAKNILKNNEQFIVYVEIKSKSIFQDVDDEIAYKKLIRNAY